MSVLQREANHVTLQGCDPLAHFYILIWCEDITLMKVEELQDQQGLWIPWLNWNWIFAELGKTIDLILCQCSYEKENPSEISSHYHHCQLSSSWSTNWYGAKYEEHLFIPNLKKMKTNASLGGQTIILGNGASYIGLVWVVVAIGSMSQFIKASVMK